VIKSSPSFFLPSSAFSSAFSIFSSISRGVYFALIDTSTGVCQRYQLLEFSLILFGWPRNLVSLYCRHLFFPSHISSQHLSHIIGKQIHINTLLFFLHS
jgi:hypothetical protein